MKCSWRSCLLCNNGLVKIPFSLLDRLPKCSIGHGLKMFQQVKTIWNNINIQPYILDTTTICRTYFSHGVISTLIVITQHGFYD
jgi:hypothetical protein